MSCHLGRDMAAEFGDVFWASVGSANDTIADVCGFGGLAERFPY